MQELEDKARGFLNQFDPPEERLESATVVEQASTPVCSVTYANGDYICTNLNYQPYTVSYATERITDALTDRIAILEQQIRRLLDERREYI